MEDRRSERKGTDGRPHAYGVSDNNGRLEYWILDNIRIFFSSKFDQFIGKLNIEFFRVCYILEKRRFSLIFLKNQFENQTNEK